MIVSNMEFNSLHYMHLVCLPYFDIYHHHGWNVVLSYVLQVHSSVIKTCSSIYSIFNIVSTYYGNTYSTSSMSKSSSHSSCFNGTKVKQITKQSLCIRILSPYLHVLVDVYIISPWICTYYHVFGWTNSSLLFLVPCVTLLQG